MYSKGRFTCIKLHCKNWGSRAEPCSLPLSLVSGYLKTKFYYNMRSNEIEGREEISSIIPFESKEARLNTVERIVYLG